MTRGRFVILLFLAILVSFVSCKGKGSDADTSEASGIHIEETSDAGGDPNTLFSEETVLEVSAKSIYPTDKSENIILKPTISSRIYSIEKENISKLVGAIEPAVDGVWSYDELSGIYSFEPSKDLNPNTEYIVTTSYKKGHGKDKVLKKISFKTMPYPVISEIFPKPGSTGVALNSPIKVQISSSIPSVTIQPQLSISSGSIEWQGWFEDNLYTQWRPLPKWDHDTVHDVDLVVRWFDKAGVMREQPFSWSFTTAYVGEDTLKHGARPDYYDKGYDIYLDDAGRVLVAMGYSEYQNVIDYQTTLLTYSSEGSLLDEKYYHFNAGMFARSIIPAGGGYYLAGFGHGDVYGHGWDLAVVYVDSDGNLQKDEGGEPKVWLGDLPVDNNGSNVSIDEFIKKAVAFNGNIYFAGFRKTDPALYLYNPALYKFDLALSEFTLAWDSLSTITTWPIEDARAMGLHVADGKLYFAGFSQNPETVGWIKSVDSAGAVGDYWTGDPGSGFSSIDIQGDNICVGGNLNNHPLWECRSFNDPTVLISAYGDESTTGNVQSIVIDNDRIYVGGYKKANDKDRRFLEVYNLADGSLIGSLVNIEQEKLGFAGSTEDIEIKEGFIYSTGKIHTSNSATYATESDMWIAKWEIGDDGAYALKWARQYTNTDTGGEVGGGVAVAQDGLIVLGSSLVESAEGVGNRQWVDKVGLKGDKMWDDPNTIDIIDDTLITSGSEDVVVDNNGDVYASWIKYKEVGSMQDAYIGRFDASTGVGAWNILEIGGTSNYGVKNLFLDSQNNLLVFGTAKSLANPAKSPGVVKKFKIQSDALEEVWTYETPHQPAIISHIIEKEDGDLILWGRYAEAALHIQSYPVRLEISVDGTQKSLKEFKGFEIINDKKIYQNAYLGGIVIEGDRELVVFNSTEADTPLSHVFLLVYDRNTSDAKLIEFDVSSICDPSKQTWSGIYRIRRLDSGSYVGIYSFMGDAITTGREQGYYQESTLVFFNDSGEILRSTDKTRDVYWDLELTGENIVVLVYKKTPKGPVPVVKWFDLMGNSQ